MALPITTAPVIPSVTPTLLSCNDGYQLPLSPLPIIPNAYFAAMDRFDVAFRKWMEHRYFLDQELQECITPIERNEAIIVVDGSFLPDSNIATAAWVFAGPDGPIQGVGYTRHPDGDYDYDYDYDYDSYRAQIFGLCMALVVRQAVCTMRPDLAGSVTLSCDNDTALRQGIEYNLWPKVQCPHFDQLSIAHKLRQDIPLHLNYSNVTGHQDRAQPHQL